VNLSQRHGSDHEICALNPPTPLNPQAAAQNSTGHMVRRERERKRASESERERGREGERERAHRSSANCFSFSAPSPHGGTGRWPSQTHLVRQPTTGTHRMAAAQPRRCTARAARRTGGRDRIRCARKHNAPSCSARNSSFMLIQICSLACSSWLSVMR
jgi:hypothetical protein